MDSLGGRPLAATATNKPVKGGGAYYLISRSPGIEFGGARISKEIRRV